MAPKEEPTTQVSQLRFSLTDVVKLIVIASGFIIQQYSFRGYVREAIIEQHGKDQIQDLRITTVENNLFVNQPALKPKQSPTIETE